MSDHEQIRALGYCTSKFNPTNPGRLCRGRECWISGWEVDEPEMIYRLMISGAIFTDDSAQDARRGLTWSGVDMGVMVKALFPGYRLLVFKEDGELATVPDYVLSEDIFAAPRGGGRRFDPCQRWRAVIDDPAELRRLIEGDFIDGALALPPPITLTQKIEELIFLLTGHGDSSQHPLMRFQPLALPELLQYAKGVICVHQDKHGPAIGVYTQEPLGRDNVIVALAESAGALAVPFSIPPMLARWDRALHEFRTHWMASRDEEFPVPPAANPSVWSASGSRSRPSTEPPSGSEE